MDKASFRRKVIFDLVSSPWTLVPAAAGISTLLVDWAAGGGLGWTAFAGFSGILAGIGSLATQWIYRWDKLTQKAFDDLQGAEKLKEEHVLDELDRALQQDGDPRTEKSLRELRDLHACFKRSSEWTNEISRDSAIEISNKMDKLFRGCIISLNRSLELWETAKKMRTPKSRDLVLQSREHLLTEIQQSIEQMAKTADEVQAFRLAQDNEESLDRIRRELDESLVVARRVEERMQEFDKELEGASNSHEKE